MKSFPPPQFIQLYPTIRCNQNCSFCFNAETEKLQDLTYDNALNFLAVMRNINIRDIDIMGGEPFLLPWMPSFLRTAVNRGIMVNISTNGSFPEVLKEFRGLGEEKINIGISLEGSSAEKHDSLTNAVNFEKAMSSISTLISAGLNPIVKTVVSRTTIPDIQAIVDLLRKNRVKRYYLIHLDLLSKAHCSQLSAISYQEFLSFYQKIKLTNSGIEINRVNASCFEKRTLPAGVRCAGGVRKLSVMPDGSTYPCNLFLHSPEFKLGNIFIDSFSEIWSSPMLTYFRIFQNNSCGVNGCLNHSYCTGGCPAHAIFHKYDLDVADIRCRKQKGYFHQ